jgi:hypothetical protein
MRNMVAAVLTASLVSSGAFAASKAPGHLPAGKPAGAKEAALLGPSAFLVLAGTAIVIAGVVLTVSGNDNKGVSTPSTSSTSTAGLP